MVTDNSDYGKLNFAEYFQYGVQGLILRARTRILKIAPNRLTRFLTLLIPQGQVPEIM